jgi:NADPH-dependent glutamate synthase beta subunit-like oxidoreductase
MERDDRVIARTAVFIRPGNTPHADGLLAGLGCELDESGFVSVDATGRTSTSCVWAAGNVVDPRAQVITLCRSGLCGGDQPGLSTGSAGSGSLVVAACSKSSVVAAQLASRFRASCEGDPGSAV